MAREGQRRFKISVKPQAYAQRVEQREWLVQIVLRATDAELDQVVERLGEVICVPPDHDGPCLTPWTLMRSAVDDLDEPERSEKRGLLKDQ